MRNKPQPYAHNNPYKYVDPTGKSGEFVGLRLVLAGATVDLVSPDPSDMATPIKIPFYTAAIIGTALGGSIFWAANQVFNESTDSDASTDSDDGAQAEEWGVPSEITDKIPSSWQNKPNKKKVGIRWQDPENQGNGIRIDQGDKNNSLPSQQVDHAIVRKNGQIIGRDGKPIQGSIKNNGEQAHIPLSEYQNWKNWDSP